MKSLRMFSWVLVGLLLTTSLISTGCKKKSSSSDTGSGGGAVPAPAPTMYSVEIIPSGTGSGVVSSDPIGIDCGSNCVNEYVEGTNITLKAIPDSFSKFMGWEGACSGTDDCALSIDQDKSLSATFDQERLDGGWEGNTAENLLFELVVENNAITEYAYQFRVRGGVCAPGIWISRKTLVDPLPINAEHSFGNSFSNISGTFSSSTEVNGTIDVDNICVRGRLDFSASKSDVGVASLSKPRSTSNQPTLTFVRPL